MIRRLRSYVVTDPEGNDGDILEAVSEDFALATAFREVADAVRSLGWTITEGPDAD